MKTITIQDWAAIATMMSAVIAALYFIHKEFKKKQLRYRQLLKGLWCNVGCVDCDPESHDVYITLKVDEEDGSVTGTLKLIEAATSHERSLSVNGKLKFKSIKLHVTNIKMGIVHGYGCFTLTFMDKRNLLFKRRIDNSDIFPERTVIVRE